MLLGKADDIDGIAVRDLLALVDRRLPPERCGEIERRVARSARATDALRAQRCVRTALQAFAPPTPPALRARLRAERTPRRRPLPRLLPALATACVLAGVVLVTGLTLHGSGGGGPLEAAAALADLPALEAPPRATATALRRSFAGVTFPRWDQEFGWRATGARRGRADGRASDTVYYQHTHHRIGYTVLSGPFTGLPSRGRRIARNGVQIQLYHDGPDTVAVFARHGRTCVLAGWVHHASTLITLASQA